MLTSLTRSSGCCAASVAMHSRTAYSFVPTTSHCFLLGPVPSILSYLRKFCSILSVNHRITAPAKGQARPKHLRTNRFLPRIGSRGYHVMLATVAILILGPLGGISAAFMNFSIGFFVGGQVLAGILGSVVTLPYGADGRHGANYIQTMAASVAGMCGLGVLIQAMTWLGLPEPPACQLVLYFMCIGMFGVGIGMFYTQ